MGGNGVYYANLKRHMSRLLSRAGKMKLYKSVIKSLSMVFVTRR